MKNTPAAGAEMEGRPKEALEWTTPAYRQAGGARCRYSPAFCIQSAPGKGGRAAAQ